MMPLVRVGDPWRPFGGDVLSGHYKAFVKPVRGVDAQVRCSLH